ncbi:VIT1/CCC1 transporter family protein [Candidatus Woesearchaeota archaeon]|nr:VIT1/CCC1 transporter family protein [Candidatus Woesearchaeota archaeon]
MIFNKEGMQGATFGIMDGIITILGVMWGLSVTQDKFILVIGILTAGLADSFANAAGMHVSQETEIHHRRKEVWKSTILSFMSTFLVAIALTLPLIFFSVKNALIISALIAVVLLVNLGYFVAEIRNKKPISLILEYTLMGIVVSVICFGLGNLITWIF